MTQRANTANVHMRDAQRRTAGVMEQTAFTAVSVGA